MLFGSKIINESREKVKIVKLAAALKQSKYVDDFYTLKKFLDEKGRLIVATGRWVDGLKEGDEIEGILQERKAVDEQGFDHLSFYLENPKRKNISSQNQRC